MRPHFPTQFIQNNQYDEDVTATAFGEPGTIARSSPSTQDPLLWNAQGKLYQAKSSTYSYDAFDQNTLVATGSGSAATSIVRVGDDFEYDVGAGRATKYFSVDGIRIAVLATSYTAGNASVPPVVQRIVRRVSPLGPPFAAALLILGLASLAAVATRKRAPAWASAPGVGLLAIVLVALPVEAYAATLPSGGPGTFGRPAEPFLAYITDHLGSVRAVVNQEGIVVETRDYDPFGSDVSHVGAFSTQHRFTGQPADDQGRGLYNYGARFYNPRWGRFVSPDEVSEGLHSQGQNSYAYVLNGPTFRIDPSGQLSAAAIEDLIALGVGALGISKHFDLGPMGNFAVADANLRLAVAGVIFIAVGGGSGLALAAGVLWVVDAAMDYHDSLQKVLEIEVEHTPLDSSPSPDDLAANTPAFSTAIQGTVVQHHNGSTRIVAIDGSVSGNGAQGSVSGVDVQGTKVDVSHDEAPAEQQQYLSDQIYYSGYGGNVAQAVSLALWAANIGW